MRVYLRLQADAKWFDIPEEDIRIWFQQLSPDGYERNKRNVQHTIKKLQYLVSLIEDANSASNHESWLIALLCVLKQALTQRDKTSTAYCHSAAHRSISDVGTALPQRQVALWDGSVQ